VTAEPPHRASRARRARERRLGGYESTALGPREIVERPGARGSRLVVDRAVEGHGDCRLVAHLAADEPADNAELACARYLESDPATAPRCRPVACSDFVAAPFARREHAPPAPDQRVALVVPGTSRAYRIERVAGRLRIPELRWLRTNPDRATVSLRDAVGDLQDYEPACEMTAHAMRAEANAEVSTSTLAVELARVQGSAIVLNRGLREAVLAALVRDGLSMSEIAMRCGRVKRDARGNASGETSWLARRVGMLAEGGQRTPTPWIHSDVLALIARRGLGVSPREVEL
jgi:hypothetical protein